MGLKENVAGIWLFKACWGKRYVAVGSWGEGLRPSPDPPPQDTKEVKKVPHSFLQLGGHIGP